MKKSDKKMMQISDYLKGRYYLNMKVCSHSGGNSAHFSLAGMFLTKFYRKETELTAFNDTKYEIKMPNLIVRLTVKSTSSESSLDTAFLPSYSSVLTLGSSESSLVRALVPSDSSVLTLGSSESSLDTAFLPSDSSVLTLGSSESSLVRALVPSATKWEMSDSF
jgi:hypothetical protein